MPATATQKRNVTTEFLEVTQVSRESAQQYLKNNNYDLNAALNQFYNDPIPSAAGKKGAKAAPVEPALNEIFDSFKSIKDESKTEEELDLPEYAEALGIEGASDIYVLADIWQVEGLQFTRKVFVDGWKRVSEETGGKVAPNMDAHKKFFRSRVDLIRKDPNYFKKVYRNAFIAGREPGQREMDMGRALDFWPQLFEPTMNTWHSANVDWCEAWNDYLTEKFWVENKQPKEGQEGPAGKWSRSVSKDLWNQTLVFAAKTLEDETLSFWSEEQAWPGIIDEFVVWCREKGLVPAGGAGGMEVDK